MVFEKVMFPGSDSHKIMGT